MLPDACILHTVCVFFFSTRPQPGNARAAIFIPGNISQKGLQHKRKLPLQFLFISGNRHLAFHLSFYLPLLPSGSVKALSRHIKLPKSSQTKPLCLLLVWIKLITAKIRICGSWLVLWRRWESHHPLGASTRLRPTSSLSLSLSSSLWRLFIIVLFSHIPRIWQGIQDSFSQDRRRCFLYSVLTVSPFGGQHKTTSLPSVHFETYLCF